MSQRFPILPALLALLIAAPAARAATHEVIVRNYDFIPKVVNINVGDTVVWQQQDPGHSVLADAGLPQPAEPAGPAGAGHERVRDLPIDDPSPPRCGSKDLFSSCGR